MGTVADRNVGFLGEVTSADTPLVLGKGALYSIVEHDDLRPTATGAGDRAVTVTAGSAWGDGVLSIWNTGATLNAGLNNGSARRWDTLVIRRTWTPLSTPTGTATLMILAGGATKAIAAGRLTARGTGSSDQPLALLGIDVGSGVVNELVDLRCFSGNGGGLVASDTAALGYLDDVGTVVRIADKDWARVLVGTTPTWRSQISVDDPAAASHPITRQWLMDADLNVQVDRLPAIPRAKLAERGWFNTFGPYDINPNSTITRTFSIPDGRFDSAPAVTLSTTSSWANAGIERLTKTEVEVVIRNLSAGITLNNLYLHLHAEVRG